MASGIEAATRQTQGVWMPVARLLRPQGRRGELLAEPLTNRLGLFSPGQELLLEPEDVIRISSYPVVLENFWQPQGRNAGRLVVKLAGIDSITAAEAVQSSLLLIDEASLPALEEDTFYVRDLLGCDLFDRDTPIGTIIDLHFQMAPDGHTRLADAPDLLEVRLSQSPESDPVLLPFLKTWLLSVDLAARRVTMHLPSGLIDSL